MPDTVTISPPGAATAIPDASKSQDPGPGQVAQSGQQTTQQAPAQAQSPEVKAEDILKLSGFNVSPEEEAERLRREYGASSREAKKLNEQLKAVQKALAEEQGIDLIFDKESKYQGLKANERYSKEAAKLEFSFDELSDKQKQLFQDDPEKAFKEVASMIEARARKALTRVAPTVDKFIEPVSPEKLRGIHDFLASRKDPLTGDAMYPEYAQAAPIMEQLATDPTLPKEVKDAINAHPSVMMELLYGRIVLAKQRAMQVAQKRAEQLKAKELEAQRAAQTSPTGAGSASIATSDAQATALKALRDASPA